MIKKYCSDMTFIKGKSLYSEGYVLNIKVDRNNYYNSKEFDYVEANIDSTNYSEFLAKIMVDKENQDLMDFSCSCDFFENKRKKNKVCEHIVAAYLCYMNEYKKETETDIDKLMKAYKGISEEKFIKTKLKLEIKLCCSFHDFLQNSVELKIGENRTYFVKNIRDFLRSYKSQEDIGFGKNFILSFKRYEFEEKDRKIIDFLYNIVEATETLIPEYYYSNSAKKITSSKKLYIADCQLRNLMELLKGKTIELSLPFGDYETVKISEEEMTLEFSLTKTEEDIRLQHKENMPFPLNKEEEYYFYQGAIYRLSEEKRKYYMPIVDLMSWGKKDYIEIKEKDKMNFASFLLPKLKKMSKVHIEDVIREEFYEEELNIKIYIDKDLKGISLKLIFQYGELELNPSAENLVEKQKGILIRNVEKESLLINTIKSFGFIEEEEGFLLQEEDNIIEFLSKNIETLKEIGEVYYSESFKNIKIYDSSKFKAAVRLNKSNMLEFSFSIEGLSDKDLIRIFKAIKEKKKYYKLEDGVVLLQEEALNSILDIYEDLDIKYDEIKDGTIALSKYNAFYIDGKLSDKIDILSKDKAFRELISSIKGIKDMDFYVPKELKGTLRPYQVIGYKWFKTLDSYGFGGILADEMGLGKTLQTIAFLTSERGTKPSIIICPTSLVYNWLEEIQRFSPELKVAIISGDKIEREEIISSIKSVDVVITSYPLIRRDIESYKDIQFKYCILDEAQQIKNPLSQNAKCVKSIKAENRFVLTGTPIENSLTELWSIFDFIMPGYLSSHSKFYSKYENPIAKYKNEKALSELNAKIRPFILRRLKKEVVKELPQKIEHKIVVDMMEEQKNLYASYVSIFKKELEEEIELKGISKSKIKILSALTRLRQICCDPSTFIEDYKGESGKLNSLYEILDNCVEEGHKVLLFSQFTSVLKNIGKELKKREVGYQYIDGAVDALDRIRRVKAFNEGNDKVFLISLKAGGTGLNLTSADVVIHFDPWWNPAVEDQATDRAHRIGQKNTVEVIKLIAKGSIEEKIFKLQQKKKHLVNNIIGEESLADSIISDMCLEDIIELFS